MQKKGGIQSRVRQYRNHELIIHHNHCGGHWLKTLYNWKLLCVYSCVFPEPIDGLSNKKEMMIQKEYELIEIYRKNNKKCLPPFANLYYRDNGKQVNKNLDENGHKILSGFCLKS